MELVMEFYNSLLLSVFRTSLIALNYGLQNLFPSIMAVIFSDCSSVVKEFLKLKC
jgi:hypothetical protein